VTDAPSSLIATTRVFAGAFAAYAGRRGAIAATLVAAGALIEGIGIAMIVPILGIVTPGSGGGIVAAWLATAGIATPHAQLAALLAAFVGMMAMRAIVLYARDLALVRLQTGFVEAIRNRVIGVLARAPWSSVAGLRHARITNLMSADVQRIAASAQFLVQGGVALIMLVIQSAIAIALAPLLAGGVALLLLAAGVATVRRGRHARDLGGGLMRASLSLMHSTTGFLGGLKAAVAENGQPRFAEEFAHAQADMSRHQIDFARRQAATRATFTLASAVAGAAIVLAGVALSIEASILITLIVIFTRMSGPALTIQAALHNFFFGLPSFEAVRALEHELGGERSAIAPAEPPPGDIVLDAATLVHPGGGGVAAVSLTIAAGSIVGVAGPSGAGKTSLIDLIAGLVAPDAGTVAIGGVLLDEAGRAGWRGRVGYVPQDGFLFHDSIRRNLTWGGDIDDRALAAALAATGADAVVARLEHGLDTIVGERGARLSGGERQRIAIARALLRRPRLLILDEATSAIDVASERLLLDALVALVPRPTIVIVAHRAESLARCDRIVRVENGRAVR